MSNINYEASHYAVLLLLPPMEVQMCQYPALEHLQPMFSCAVRDQVSHPYKTTSKIIFPYIVIFVSKFHVCFPLHRSFHSICSRLRLYVTFHNMLISNFRRVLNVVCFLLGYSPASEFYMPTFRNTLSFPSS